MRFSCGDSLETRTRKWMARVSYLENWHPFFPLWPRTVAQKDGKDICAWLEPIERKGVYSLGEWFWDYRLPQFAANGCAKESE